MTLLLESEVAGSSEQIIYVEIESDVEQRFDVLQLREGQGQWIQEGIERPQIKGEDSVSYVDGVVKIRFPTDFVVPEGWIDFKSDSRELQQ